MVGEDVERPGRLTEKQIAAIRGLWKKGLAIGEIEKLTGAGRATVHRYTRDVPRFDENEPLPGKNEVFEPIPPQVIDLQPVEEKLPQPPAAVPAQVHVGMGILIDFDVIAVLKGFSAQVGYSDFNEYLQKRLVPWIGAVKDLCLSEGAQDFFEKMTQIHNEAAEAYRLLGEEKQRQSWPAGRGYLIKNMQILGWTPEQIQRETASIDEIAQRTRAFSS